MIARVTKEPQFQPQCCSYLDGILALQTIRAAIQQHVAKECKTAKEDGHKYTEHPPSSQNHGTSRGTGQEDLAASELSGRVQCRTGLQSFLRYRQCAVVAERVAKAAKRAGGGKLKAVRGQKEFRRSSLLKVHGCRHSHLCAKTLGGGIYVIIIGLGVQVEGLHLTLHRYAQRGNRALRKDTIRDLMSSIQQ